MLNSLTSEGAEPDRAREPHREGAREPAREGPRNALGRPAGRSREHRRKAPGNAGDPESTAFGKGDSVPFMASASPSVSEVTIRRARTTDVRAVRRLIDVYSRDRILLDKATVTLYEDI